MISLLGVDHRQRQIAVTLLLADGRTDLQAVVLDLHHCGRWPAPGIHYLDSMHGFGGLFLHRFVNRLLAITGAAIYAGAEHEVRSQRLTLAEQFVDVAFAIPDMHATVGGTESASVWVEAGSYCVAAGARGQATGGLQLAKRLRINHTMVHNSETAERRVDVAEFIDWATACGLDPMEAFEEFLKWRR
jgi:hypothetical protein